MPRGRDSWKRVPKATALNRWDIMTASVFLSHSFGDGSDAAKRLQNELSRLKDVSVFAPTRSMRLGHAWHKQAHEAIFKADAVLYLLTEKSLDINSACRMECIMAQEMGTPVIPLRVSKVDVYPDYIPPRAVWVDLVKNYSAGLKRLEQEIEHIHALGMQRNPIRLTTWHLGHGELFHEDQSLFPGEWLITRRMIPGEKFAFIPKTELFLRETGRFRERTVSAVTRMLRTEGMWSFHADESHLLLFQDAATQKTMTVTENLGPNRFGGMMGGRRYKAERLLEFR